jgi:outer membrane protein assembly factor BamB
MRLAMNRTMSWVFVAAMVSLSPPLLAAESENWPQWRGARLDGISGEKDVPTQWSKESNVAWKVPMPGPAGSTPAVWGERIFVTSVHGEDLVLLCLGTDGKEQWKQVVDRGNRDVRGDEGNTAAPSPSTDGKHVWVFFANGMLACYTVEGKEVWKENMQDRFGKFNIAFGLTSTPVLDRGRLYLQFIHGDGNPATQEAKVVCLDAASSKTIWEVQRKSDGRDENEHSYASPVLYRSANTEYLITHGNDYAVGHSLEDGSEIWRLGGLNPKGSYEPTLRFVASPVAVPGFIVVPTAKGRGVYCLKGDELKGDVTDNDDAFHWRRSADTPDVPSPLVVGDLVYLCRENGNLICLDAKTGKEYYNRRTTPDRHRASPVYADGHIYLSARNGRITVVKEGTEFEVASVNDLGEDISASPAISNGRIYIRTFQNLWAIGEEAKDGRK